MEIKGLRYQDEEEFEINKTQSPVKVETNEMKKNIERKMLK